MTGPVYLPISGADNLNRIEEVPEQVPPVYRTHLTFLASAVSDLKDHLECLKAQISILTRACCKLQLLGLGI